MILIIVIIVVLVLLVLFFMSSYNKLVHLSNRVDEGFSTMDVYLKKRFDLIPNLVETVKGYAKHEADTLSSVIAQRNMAKTSKDVMDSENKITNAIQGIFAVAEQYPDLKANTNFMDLQNQLKSEAVLPIIRLSALHLHSIQTASSFPFHNQLLSVSFRFTHFCDKIIIKPAAVTGLNL